MKNVIRDLLLRKRTLARMADADSEPPEVRRAERGDDVLESVVPGAAAAQLELHGAGLQVELVVRDQDFLGRDAIEPRQRGHRLAASIDEGLRQSQSPVDAIACAHAADDGLKLRLHPE